MQLQQLLDFSNFEFFYFFGVCDMQIQGRKEFLKFKTVE